MLFVLLEEVFHFLLTLHETISRKLEDFVLTAVVASNPGCFIRAFVVPFEVEELAAVGASEVFSFYIYAQGATDSDLKFSGGHDKAFVERSVFVTLRVAIRLTFVEHASPLVRTVGDLCHSLFE